MLIRIIILTFLLILSSTKAGEIIADTQKNLNWTFEKDQNGWTSMRNLNARAVNGVLKLEVTAKDSSIANTSIHHVPNIQDQFIIEYRAIGFNNMPTHGQIFFTTDKISSFSARYHFKLPSMICDGEWRKMVVSTSQIAYGSALWSEAKVITGLRLDMADEFPGNIEIKSILLTNSSSKIERKRDCSTVWDFTKPQPGWGRTHNLTATPQDDGLRLDITGYDSRLIHDNLSIDGAKYRGIRITYRAKGLPSRTTGEIYFATVRNPKFSDSRVIYLPTLISDGKWHSIELQAKTWNDGSPITKLRLDPVNEFPGQIVIKSIELVGEPLQKITSLAETNLKHGYLLPAELFHDGIAEVNLPEGNYNVWARADSAPDTREQLDTLTIAHGNFIAPKDELQPQDGWKMLGNISGKGKITFSLSGKPVSGFDSLIVTPENITPCLIARPWTQKVPVEINTNGKTPSQMKVDPYRPYWKGKMIHYPGAAYKVGNVLVRKKFSVRDELQEAFLQITADDNVVELYLNGRKVDREWSRNWKEPVGFAITNMLRKGENLLAVSYSNTDYIGGLLFDLSLVYCDRTSEVIFSDSSARVFYGIAASDWFTSDYNDTSWVMAESKAAPPEPPWKILLPYLDRLPPKGSAKIIAASVPEQMKHVEDLKLTLKLNGNPVLTEHDIVYARMFSERNVLIDFSSGPLGKFAPVFNSDGSVQITIDGFSLPRYGGKLVGRLEYGVYGREMEMSSTMGGVKFVCAERPLPNTDSLSVRVKSGNNGPSIEVNQQPFYPIFLSVFYETNPTGLEGTDSPVNVREFLAGGMSETWWIGPDRYDFSGIDMRINKIMNEYPNAYIAAWVWCQPPHWYTKMFPDRIAKTNEGKTPSYYVTPIIFSNEDYRRDAANAVSAFIEHCEKYYSGKMIAYNLCGGISLEWQGWGTHGQYRRKILMDYSQAAERDFMAYTAKKHPHAGITRTPSYKERFSSLGMLFRDPAKDIAAIAFDEYYSDSIAGCINHIARTARKTLSSNPKLLGAYYGYYFEHGNLSFNVNSSGHNALNKVLEAGHVDFLLSPPAYGARQIGYPIDEMKPFASILHHNIFPILEDDTRTHLSPAVPFYQTVNSEQTEAVTRRNWGMSLARKMPICMFPINDSWNFSSPSIRADLMRVGRAGHMLFKEDRTAGVEVAVVVDEKALKYLEPSNDLRQDKNMISRTYTHQGKYKENPRNVQYLTGHLSYFQRFALNQFGAGTDYLLVEDVPATASQYKMWIFLGNFVDSPATRAAFEAAKASGGTIIVVYGAGFITPEKAVDTVAMSQLLGINLKLIESGTSRTVITNFSHPATAGILEGSFGPDFVTKPRFAVDDPNVIALGRYTDNAGVSLAVKKIDKSKIIFCGSTLLTPGLIKAAARDAGIHIFSDSEDTLYAGYGTITMHTKSSGIKKISLPLPMDVVDLYSGEVIGKQITEFKFQTDELKTRTFITGNAEQIYSELGFKK